MQSCEPPIDDGSSFYDEFDVWAQSWELDIDDSSSVFNDFDVSGQFWGLAGPCASALGRLKSAFSGTLQKLYFVVDRSNLTTVRCFSTLSRLRCSPGSPKLATVISFQ